MLPKVSRLRRSQDFARVYQRGRRLSSVSLGFRAYRRPRTLAATTPTRIGISISQKVSKRAVVRNRIKRQLRAACRQLFPQLRSGWDVVIVVRAAALQCDYPQFLQQLKQLFTDAGILHGY